MSIVSVSLLFGVALLSLCDVVSTFAFSRASGGANASRNAAPKSHRSNTPSFLLNMASVESNNKSADNADGEEEDDTEWLKAELVDDAEFYETGDLEADWLPDREIVKQQKTANQEYYQSAAANPARMPTGSQTMSTTLDGETDKDTPVESQHTVPKKGHVYTPEEEELIRAMGGKFKDAPTKRQPGYLGDCTLQEIATDYSVPVCYLADVLTMWGVPVPINIKDRLGDLVTGEQAFAILEAIHTLDIAALHDRYSDMNLSAMCDWYDIDLKDAFEFAVKEGYSLPFGVQTCLRVEQEEELVRALASEV